jgi:hypothetical protein
MASYSLLEEVWATPQTRPVARETSHLVAQNADLLVAPAAATAEAQEAIPSRDGMTDCQTRIQQLEMEIDNLRQMLSSGPQTDTSNGALDMSRNDLMFYVASGVFTLFLLDSFLNAGLRQQA